MDKPMASLHVNRTFRHNVSTAADIVFEVGDQIPSFREKYVNNRIGKWLRPQIEKEMGISRKLF